MPTVYFFLRISGLLIITTMFGIWLRGRFVEHSDTFLAVALLRAVCIGEAAKMVASEQTFSELRTSIKLLSWWAVVSTSFGSRVQGLGPGSF